MAEKHQFTCKIIFGLGITSVADFITMMGKYKLVQDKGVAYVNANTTNYPKKDGLVIFDGVRELFRFHQFVRPNQVLVISEIPTILKEVRDIVPLDFDNQRSFEFNFKSIDPQQILKALKNKTFTITSQFTSYDNLGYHVERVKNTGDFIASYIALTSNLPFDRRTAIRKLLLKFFQAKRFNASIVISGLPEICKGYAVKTELNQFLSLFKKQADGYYNAVAHAGAITTVANTFGVDAYAVSYFRKMVRSFGIVAERNSKSNVAIVA